MTEPTPRQIEVLVAYIECGSCRAAAARLGVTEHHIRQTLSLLHDVIGGTNTAQTFAIAVQRGILDLHELRLPDAA